MQNRRTRLKTGGIRSSDTVSDWLRLLGLNCNQDENLDRRSGDDRTEQELKTVPGWASVELPKRAFAEGSCQFNSSAYWAPRGIPEGSSVLFASSRIGRSPDQKKMIFDAIRTACCNMQSTKQFLITHNSLSLHEYVCRAATLFGISVVEFISFPETVSDKWIKNQTKSKPGAEQCTPCFFALQGDGESKSSIDAFMFSMAKEVRILSMSNNGNTVAAAVARASSMPNEKQFLLMDSELTNDKARKKLIQLGAIPWYLFAPEKDDSNRSHRRSFPCFYWEDFRKTTNQNNFLLHWTRRRIGPWPEQTREQFIDDLLMGTHGSRHDRVAVLIRILASGQLVASNDSIRSERPVVCFSARSIDEIPELRTFRHHRNRWDFESLGIAIDRKLLMDRGARPAIYGDESDWRRLSQKDQPFFQKNGESKIDWTIEDEWRILGNFDLKTVPVDKAFVFVDCPQVAEAVRPFSRFPVVVLAESKQSK